MFRRAALVAIALLSAAGLSQAGITAEAAAPTVTGIAPNSGHTDAATQVTISGTNFVGVSDVFFGSTDVPSTNAYPCTTGFAGCFTVDSAFQITVDTPYHVAGTVDVTVKAGGSTSATSSADHYTYTAPGPAQAVLDVTSGPTGGGTAVKITGASSPAGFFGATSVSFGSTSVTGACPPATPGAGCFTPSATNPDGEIDVQAPSGSANATSSVTVTTAGGTDACTGPVASCEFTWAPAPTATGVCAGAMSPPPCAPPSGSENGGVALTVSGADFQSSNYATGTPPLGYTTAEVDFVPAGGGTTVAVTGACPVPASTPGAGCFTVSSASSVAVTTPSTATGTFNVEVKTPGGTSAAGMTYTVTPAAPVVTSVTPNAGRAAGGDAIVIKGTGFSGATALHFGSRQVSNTPGCPPVIAGSGCFSVASATEIDATTPSGTPATPQTPVEVTVTTSGGISTPAAPGDDNFTYEAIPTISSVSPTSFVNAYPDASTLAVNGTNFEGKDNSTSAITQLELTQNPSTTDILPACGTVHTGCYSFVVGATPSVSVQLAAGLTPGTWDVRVFTAGGESAQSSGDQFTVALPTGIPTVSAVAPTAGPTAGGTTTTITGTGFTGAGFTATVVTFGTTSLSACPAQTTSSCFTIGGATSITAYTPAASAGQIDVTVTIATADGTETATSATGSGDHYTFVAPPTVTGVNPGSGTTAGGTNVTVTGTNFTDGTNYTVTGVTVGGTAATLGAVTATTVAIVTPAHVAGAFDVVVTTAGGSSATSSADHFIYIAPTPAVTSLSPNQGPDGGGVATTITGSGFAGGTTSIAFGSTSIPASSTYPCAGSPTGCFSVTNDTTIAVYTPQHTDGTVHVSVTTYGGVSPTSAGDGYTFLPIPTVTGIAPSAGPTAGGTHVTVTGTSFTTATQVNVGGTAVTSHPCVTSPCFTVVSATSINLVVPAGAAGTDDITVVTPGGTSPTSASDRYAYVSQPTVSSINPTAGPAAGGATVTVTGTNFTGAGYTVTGVTFGGTAGTNVSVTSATTLTVTEPAGSAGTTGDVVVSTVGGSSATSGSDVFTWVAAPTVTQISPTSGPSTGGTTVTVTGTNFTGAGFSAPTVRFGASGTPLTPFSVTSSSLQVTAPSGQGGTTADVLVTTPGGTSATSSADVWTWVGPPAVTSLSPDNGPAAGGTDVTVTGLGFTGNGFTVTGVSFGGGAPVTPTNVTPTSLHVIAPAGTAGHTVDVTVTTSGGTSPVTAADEYVYDLSRLVSAQQYTLAGSDGATWQAVDGATLSTTFTPNASSTAIVTGNADLWTDTAGFNQDVGICVTGSGVTGTQTGPGGCAVVAWKESGGNAGTFSPNAATVQGVFHALAGHSYAVQLVWKSNRAMPAGDHVVIGAGNKLTGFSPTTVTTLLSPDAAANTASASVSQQYSLATSDGSTWAPIDGTHLSLTVSPTSTSLLEVTANADLWTAASGVNQDIGIDVFQGVTPPAQPLAWKESGGYAGTFSPNAAFVQGTTTLAPGTYTVELVWKSNHAMSGGQSIWVAAGHPSPGFSPTTLFARLEPAANLVSAVSTHQYLLTTAGHDDGTAWRAVDGTNLDLTVPAQSTRCQVVIGGNADLWTAASGYNQDLGLQLTPQGGSSSVLAWKESGGYAGTFSPNAAFVSAAYTLAANTQLSVELVWRTNRSMPPGDTIAIGAGGSGSFSPTSVTAYLSC